MSSLRLEILKSNLYFFSVIALLGLTLNSGRALAQDSAAGSLIDGLGPSGSLRAAYFNRDRKYSDKRDYSVNSLWLKLNPNEVSGYKFYFEGFAQGEDSVRSKDLVSELREAYVTKSTESFDLKVGRSILVWGRGDKVNPTDNLSVKNLKYLFTDDEDQRLGLFSTQIVFNSGLYKIIGIWIPEWREPVYPLRETPGVSLNSKKPDSPQNQFAFKIDNSGGAVDWSVSYFDGYNKTPDLEFISAGPSGVNLELIYNHIQVYGADFATSLGDYGVRGELAYTKTKDNQGSDPLTQNSNLFAVLGADRNIFENFNFNTQILWKQVEDFVDPNEITNGATRSLANTAALNFAQQYRQQLGFSLRPSYKAFNDTLEIETAYVSWSKQGDYLLRPKVTYAYSDRLKLIAGGEFYNGPSDSLFGRLADISTGYFEVRYLF